MTALELTLWVWGFEIVAWLAVRLGKAIGARFADETPPIDRGAPISVPHTPATGFVFHSNRMYNTFDFPTAWWSALGMALGGPLGSALGTAMSGQNMLRAAGDLRQYDQQLANSALLGVYTPTANVITPEMLRSGPPEPTA